MLREIRSQENIPAYLERVKRGEFRLFGFGHRIYKKLRSARQAHQAGRRGVFDVTGKNPLIDIAVELERIALAGGLLRHAEAVPQRWISTRGSSTKR